MWTAGADGQRLSSEGDLNFPPPDPYRRPRDLLPFGKAWLVATERGLFARSADGYLRWPSLSGNWPIAVRAMRLAPTGALWLATNQGAFYSPEPKAFLEGGLIEQWFQLAGLPSRDITAVLPDGAGAWIGTENGLVYWEPE